MCFIELNEHDIMYEPKISKVKLTWKFYVYFLNTVKNYQIVKNTVTDLWLLRPTQMLFSKEKIICSLILLFVSPNSVTL